MKQEKMSYQKILLLMEDATEAKTVAVVMVIALAAWKKKEISDYYMAEVIRFAAERFEDLV